ncbi:DNA (cytosine-5-)-methyltransferase [Clostridium sp. YIM B02551]|uniref:DNA (cytosine-5-)-methyltransferase n=1 Tax=Clostridium sp. YIM B02551 TaxID=2910679 RepID=UPI001EEB22F4|nr:DNA (cytosine-5-)-methyltransferase [Clostridium sp. YIM B02551]
MKILSLFSGIGAFEKALENLKVDYELVNYCEIDKFASYAYEIIHNKPDHFNLGDITKVNINLLKDFDLLTHGSPCQSFSLAGNGEGGDEGSGTKSSLMWYTVDIIRNKMPKYIIWENVKAVICKKHKHNFDKYISTLSDLGYNNYFKVLNSKDYGAAQSRERLFVISIRKDADTKGFLFKVRDHRKTTMRDILDVYTDEKYYIKDNIANELTKRFEMKLNNRKPSENGILKLGDINNPKLLDMNKRVFSKDGTSPTLLTGGDSIPKIVECRIRRLNPHECWKLQGFGDEYHKVKEALEEKFYNGKDNSDSQMYKMAGNSINVDVLEDLFFELFIER